MFFFAKRQYLNFRNTLVTYPTVRWIEDSWNNQRDFTEKIELKMEFKWRLGGRGIACLGAAFFVLAFLQFTTRNNQTTSKVIT